MKIEKPYEFRDFLDQVHDFRRRNPDVPPCGKQEVEIDESWRITLSENASDGLQRTAADRQDYLWVSMGLSLKIGTGNGENTICFTEKGTEGRGFTYTVTPHAIRIDGDSWIGAANGGYFLEDLMNLRDNALNAYARTLSENPPFEHRRTEVKG